MRILHQIKEKIDAAIHGRTGAPPRAAGRRVSLTRLWEALPDETRRQTLTQLSRIVIQQLAISPEEREVSHDDC